MDYEYYLSERIVNMQEFEGKTAHLYATLGSLCEELEKEKPSTDRVNGLSRMAFLEAHELKDFDIIIEARRVRMVKEES